MTIAPIRAAFAAAAFFVLPASCTPTQRSTVVDIVDVILPAALVACALANQQLNDADLQTWCKITADEWPIVKQLLASAKEGARKAGTCR